jgi:hypothetical protein
VCAPARSAAQPFRFANPARAIDSGHPQAREIAKSVLTELISPTLDKD